MDFKKLSNTDLIKRCAEASTDRQAWNEFVRRFHDHICLMVARQSRRKNLHEEYVQGVYVRLLRENRKALWDYQAPNDNAIYSFLAVIARNVIATDFIRKNTQKRRGIEIPLENPEPPAPGDDGPRRIIDIISDPHSYAPDESLKVEDLWRAGVLYLNERLTGHDRERDIEIFRLFICEGLSPMEIAVRMHLSPKRVRNIITEIRKKFREGGPETFR